MFFKILKYLSQSDKYFSISVAITVFSIFVILGFFLFFYNRLPDTLPLFYSLPWGENQLAVKQQFLLLPIILTLICLVNALISSQLHPVQYLLKRMLLFSLIILDLILMISALKIILIFI